MMKDCPNRKTLMINHLGQYESESDEENNEVSEHEPSFDQEDEIEFEYGESLICKRILHAHPASCEDNQRENLFHTRCLAKGKVCNMIIDGGSCCNIASTELISKLQITTFYHHRPYKLHWMNDCGELKVNKQAKVTITLGHYEDTILCDIVPMQACHILLGRPWQYDRRVVHDGYTNRFSFTFKVKNIVLKPMSSMQIDEAYEKKKEKDKEQGEKMKPGKNTTQQKVGTPSKPSQALAIQSSNVLLASKSELQGIYP